MEEMICFPHLGIVLPHVGRSFSVFGIEITYYGVILAIAMVAGINMSMMVARRTGQNEDMYFNFAIIAIVCSVLGARIYYVAFSWEYYRVHPEQILNFRGGGLAIYGGILAGILTSAIYAALRRVKLSLLLDTASVGIITGQIIGRWGNFFNREAFGAYTDTLFAMQLPEAAVNSADITSQMREHMQVVSGVPMIQVHPAFLYESLWNLGVLLLLLYVTLGKRKHFDGEVFWLYLLGYSLGRIWIENLRSDQLLIPGTGLAVSQVLSGVLILCALAALVRGRRKRS